VLATAWYGVVKEVQMTDEVRRVVVAVRLNRLCASLANEIVDERDE